MKFANFISFSFIIFLLLLLVVLFYHGVYGCMFSILLFDSLSYVFLLLCLCFLIVTCAPFYILFFDHANWHFSGTLTEGFPCIFLSCNINATV